MKDVNLGEDTIQKTEILMNSARLLPILCCIIFGLIATEEVDAQDGTNTRLISAEEIIDNDRIFEIYMNRYKPQKEAVQYLNTLRDSAAIYVFLGSWCRETKKYIPGLMKTLAMADSPFITTKYVEVDAEKKFPKSFLKKFDIEYIPTVVVLKGNDEIGRIEEKPHELIETDLVEILKKAMRNYE